MRVSLLIWLLGILILTGCLPVAAQGPDTLRLVFIGDVMSHGPQNTAALRAGGDRSNPDDYNYESYFKHLQSRFAPADLVVANMEFPVGIRPFSGYPFFSAPQSLPREASRSGVGLFLTANNHLCDKGRAGMDSTYVYYSRLGVPFTGFYRSAGEEYENNPLILDIRGHRIAFLNFTYGTNGLPVPPPYRINVLDSTHVKEVVARARKRGAEFLIALPHWGDEYKLTPVASERYWADLFFREGVDVVIGGHPHVVQPVEDVPPRAIAWSLGNYVSNQSDVNTQIGMLLELTLVCDSDGTITVAGMDPTYLWCSRRRMLEPNYTVIPIEEWIGTRDRWLDPSEYDKMVREWENLKRFFRL